MAYDIGINDVLLITVEYEQDSQTMLNTFCYKPTAATEGGIGEAEVIKALAAFKATKVPALKENMSASVLIVSVRGQIIYPNRRPYEQSPVGTLGDIVETTPLPPANQVSLTRVSTLATKGATGGLRIPGVPLEYVENGELTNEAYTNYGVSAIALAKSITPDMSEIEWQPIIFSPRTHRTENYVRNIIVQRPVRTVSRRVVRRGI